MTIFIGNCERMFALRLWEHFHWQQTQHLIVCERRCQINWTFIFIFVEKLSVILKVFFVFLLRCSFWEGFEECFPSSSIYISILIEPERLGRIFQLARTLTNRRIVGTIEWSLTKMDFAPALLTRIIQYIFGPLCQQIVLSTTSSTIRVTIYFSSTSHWQ